MPLRRAPIDSDLVDIVRDFMAAHRMLRQLAARHRSGQLAFAEVQELVGDGEEAVLFRLKERSHILFRDRMVAAGSAIGPEELFDLAIGSLFHEAMKFRENFYQRDVYGPKIRALREASVPDAAGLLSGFERILGGAGQRLDESLGEAEQLLVQTSAQFRVLLRAHAGNGFVTRHLVENDRAVEDVFGEPIDAVLADLHGSAGLAHARAARSYLESGFFSRALRALDAAASRGERPVEMRRLRSYAQGMQAYLEGRYTEALDALTAWVDAKPHPDELRFAELALAAVSRVGQLVGEDAEAEIGPRAAGLAERIRELSAPRVRAHAS